MLFPPRRIGIMFQIDTNRINAKQQIENMNLLEKWAKDGVIDLEASEVVLEESFAGNNVERKRKAEGYIYSITYAEADSEKDKIKQIEAILFPDGIKDENQKNDVEIVFNASKYSRFLVTRDGGSKKQPGGILGNKEKLKNELGITVMNDQEAVDLINTRIQKRDNLCKHIAKGTGNKLPEWVGRD